MNPTMTLKECAAAMREAGFRTSETRLADDIERGVKPFGRVVRVGNSGRRTLEIMTVDFRRWLEGVTCS